jgi:hypothetical protein
MQNFWHKILRRNSLNCGIYVYITDKGEFLFSIVNTRQETNKKNLFCIFKKLHINVLTIKIPNVLLSK